MKKPRLITILVFIMSFSSCEELLFEDDITSMEVTLTAPSSNAVISSNLVRFDWTVIEGASSYNIQVAKPNFENANQIVLNVDQESSFAEVSLNPGNYKWRVKAVNGGYETSYTTASFMVIPAQNFSENNIVLLSPEDELITNSSDQLLTWQQIDGTLQYRIQVWENSNLVLEETTSNSNYNFEFQEGEFHWQVRAENGSENTQYTTRSLLVDTTSPNIPTLVAPENNSIITSNEIELSWTRQAVAGSIETDSLLIFRDTDLSDPVLSELVTSPFSVSLDNDTYYWFLKASDEAGNESLDSEVFSFTINN